MYREPLSSVSFPKLEEQILKFWEDNKIFYKSLENKNKDYVFYDGPPGTNGHPHIGHMLQSVLKDLWPRYKAMQGYRVIRKAGWDTHGLPIELTAEKELGLNSKADVEDYGVSKFIDYCRKTVFRYKGEWVNAIRRIGRFLDFEDEYATLTNDFIQSDWWVLKRAWEKGLLYQGHKVIAHCPRLGTSLSNHEVAQGYRDVVDISIFAKFAIRDEDNTFFLAWTTTPWTLLGNVALALAKDIDYVKIRVNNEKYILAEARLKPLEDKGFLADYDIIERYKGSDLVNIDYEPLWGFHSGFDKRKHFTINDDYVTTEDGTGIVHLALYGEDDYRIIKKYDLPYVQHINLSGYFTNECGDYAGKYFTEDGMDVNILKDLSSRGLVFAKERLEHSYPFCYRTGARLMYYAKSSWFIKTTAYKDRMLLANKDINWYPGHIRDGRFGNWLENNVDWCISRERYWGSPLPIWTCTNGDCKHQICVESIKELNDYSKVKIDDDFDLHIPEIDKVICTCPKCKSDMTREPDVLDCWYNSGIMPWGQFAYPSKDGSTELLNSQYPADFICEGQDQTRGWFYALLAISTMLTDRSSYKNVICTELVLDKDGHKMSKSKGNVVDPADMVNKYGADAMRWLFLNTSPGNSIRFSEDALKDNLKQIILPIWNIYSFFVTYARIDNYKPDDIHNSSNPLDLWILSETKGLITGVTKALDSYDSSGSCQHIFEYIDKLSNWYIRRSRRRFWKSESDNDKKEAYDTLYSVFVDLLKVLAPFLPFITEEIYQQVVRSVNLDAKESIHLCDYPVADDGDRSLTLEHEMNLIRTVVSLGRSLRNKYGIKVRQPLSELIVVCHNRDDERVISAMSDLVCEELNVKSVVLAKSDKDLVILTVKPNLKKLGPMLGKELKKVIPIISALTGDDIIKLEGGNGIELGYDDKVINITLDDVLIQRKERPGLVIEVSDDVTVALNSEITTELRKEGFAREFVNKVQNMRKEYNFDVLDRIRVDYSSSNTVRDSITWLSDYIKNETLAVDIIFNKSIDGEGKEWDLNGEQSIIRIKKV